MAQAFKRMGAWVHHRFGKRSVVGLAVLFGLWLLEQATGDLFSDTVLPFLVAQVTALLARPIGFFGVLLVGLLAVLIITAFVESSPFVAWLEEALARRQPPVFDANAHAEEPAKLQAEVDGLKRALFKQDERWRYGEELRELVPLPDVQREEVVSRVAELLPTSRQLMHWCEEVWRTVRPPAGEGVPESAVSQLVPLAEERARDPLYQAAHALNGLIENRRDPRAVLVCFYARYREWRTWVMRMARFNGRDVQSAPGYAEWWRFDDKWREELVQKVAAPNLASVRRLLADYNEMHGELVAMPPPTSPSTPTAPQSGPGLGQWR